MTRQGDQDKCNNLKANKTYKHIIFLCVPTLQKRKNYDQLVPAHLYLCASR